MDTVILVARLLLAAVFAVAGLTKLADRAGSRQAVRDFGLPASLSAPLGILLPLAELAVAVALIPKASAWWGAIGALVLLLAFIAGIGYNLARGRKPDCHCFGQLYSAPVGTGTLIRNGILAAVATLVVARGPDDPGRSVVALLGDLSTAERVGLVAGLFGLTLLAVGGWALVHLLGQNGRILGRLDALEARLDAGGVGPTAVAAPTEPDLGLPVGAPAPAFSLSGLYGETMTLDALRATGKPTLLLFSDPGCGPCNALLPDLGRWQREHAASLTIALISRGAPEANRAKVTEHGLTHVLLQRDQEVAETYQANGTPIAVVVRPDGTVGSPLAPGADAVRALVARTVGRPDSAAPPVPAPQPALARLPAPVPMAGVNGNGHGGTAPMRPGESTTPQVGDLAPTLTFPDLEGRSMSVAGFRGHQTVVLFWNPGCGFCSRMLDDLKAWEMDRPAGAPKLLVVSTGTVEANRAMGLHAPVVLDQGFEAGRAFGATGTPAAVLVDPGGRIASPLAVGAPAVLALARGEAPSGSAPNGNGAAAPVAPTTPKVGDPAPKVVLPDLNGRTVDLARLRGSRTLVVFWNPGCGFCARMLDDLKAWDAKPPKGAPKMLVVSTGDIEANKAMGLRSPVVLDQGFTVGNAFGASGTPSAVLVDARGKVASEIAVGADAVLTLARSSDAQPKAALAGEGV